MTDVIVRLMLAFPGRFIYLRGTHESFSHEVSKGGVPQGHIWKTNVKERRGEEFVDLLARFYAALPYVVSSRDFVACHAGPPLELVSRQRIIDIHRHPSLRYQLTWNRLRTVVHPTGYTKREVSAFKKAMGLNKSGAFIVSHSPLPDGGTVWLDLGGIKNHHLVFSGEREELAVFTRVGGELTPLVYHKDPALEIVNAAAPPLSARFST